MVNSFNDISLSFFQERTSMKKTISKFGFLALGLAMAMSASVNAQSFVEGFETVTPLTGTGTPTQVTSNFTGILRSTTLGTSGIFQGNSGVFPAQAGDPTSYAGMNFNNTTGVNTISTWLATNVLTLNNGDTFSFFTRTVPTPAFPDRLQVRLSQGGASLDVGATSTSVGDFSVLLLDINPNYSTTGYPADWTQFTATVSGLSGPTQGRIAFRYFVEGGGPSGNNSDYIGIDSVSYTAIPEPTSIALLGLGFLGLVARRRK
jgi:hypothetical protein